MGVSMSSCAVFAPPIKSQIPTKRSRVLHQLLNRLVGFGRRGCGHATETNVVNLYIWNWQFDGKNIYACDHSLGNKFCKKFKNFYDSGPASSAGTECHGIGWNDFNFRSV